MSSNQIAEIKFRISFWISRISQRRSLHSASVCHGSLTPSRCYINYVPQRGGGGGMRNNCTQLAPLIIREKERVCACVCMVVGVRSDKDGSTSFTLAHFCVALGLLCWLIWTDSRSFHTVLTPNHPDWNDFNYFQRLKLTLNATLARVHIESWWTCCAGSCLSPSQSHMGRNPVGSRSGCCYRREIAHWLALLV